VLPEPVTLATLLQLVATTLCTNRLSVIGDSQRQISTVALCTGGGGDYLMHAIKMHADCYLTGELKHHQALLARQERLSALIHTVERTILHLKGNVEMESEELFAGFSEEQQKKYEEEAHRRWGDHEVKESQKRWGSYSKENKKQIMEEGGANYQALVAAMPFGPASPQAQEGIRRWHEHLRYFYEPTTEVLLGLADMYNDDPRFAEFFQRIHPDLAPFVREAIHVYCQERISGR
jgi:hypothetical protein